MKQHLVERMLYIVLALTFVGVAFLTILQGQSNARLQAQQTILQEQVAGQKEVLKGVQKLLSNDGKTSKEINKSLACILVFFGSPNRANFYISDFATCTITDSRTGDTQILPLPTVQNTNNNTQTQGQPNTSSRTTAQPKPQTPQQPQEPPKTTPPVQPPLQPETPVERLKSTLTDAITNVLERVRL